MSRELSFSEIHEQLRTADFSGCRRVNLTILRNVVVEAIEPYLRYLGYQAGFDVAVTFGEFDNVYQEAVGDSPELLNAETSCVLVFQHLELLSWNLARRLPSMTLEEVDTEAQRTLESISAILSGIRRQTPAMIICCGLLPPVHPAYGIADSQLERGQSRVVEDLNRGIQSMLSEIDNAYFLDLAACRARLGEAAFFDARYWHIGRAPYSRSALGEVAHETAAYLRAMYGKNKKCLVLDCDNVLWGGIVGEDGLAGIQLGPTHPGSAYHEFQQEVLNLFHRGVILALCSKNNEEDVLEVFEKHPDTLLQAKHFAATRINWQDKATNIRELVDELNIALNAVVFADDSEFEIDLVRSILPEVATIHLPESRAVDHRAALLSSGFFETLTVSEEDRRRGEMYRAEAGRRKLRAATADLADYLKSLEMNLELEVANDVSIPRIAQLTQKTNQFNLTTRRHTDEEIKRFANDNDHEVVSLRLRDRYGDSGIVGVGILEYEGPNARLETFLLSCRVLGRGVEEALLFDCVQRTRARGCETLIGEYIPTAKNAQVKDFYQKHGFEALGGEDDISRYRRDVASLEIPEPSHFVNLTSDRKPTSIHVEGLA